MKPISAKFLLSGAKVIYSIPVWFCGFVKIWSKIDLAEWFGGFVKIWSKIDLAEKDRLLLWHIVFVDCNLNLKMTKIRSKEYSKHLKILNYGNII